MFAEDFVMADFLFQDLEGSEWKRAAEAANVLRKRLASVVAVKPALVRSSPESMTSTSGVQNHKRPQ